uniref:BUD13 homolog n=1 Tax=Glossina brevipalpis TaxID=37001 RepID=A0A1A9X2C0_9MUSC
MSLKSIKKIDQKEYLKRYLSGDKIKKKKKKDKKHKKETTVKIIDDDVNQLDCVIDIDEELLLTGDDAPQIVGEYIELCPPNEKKWKSIAIKEEPCEENVFNSNSGRNEDEDRWGRKAEELRIKEEPTSPTNRKSRTTPDISPPRRKKITSVKSYGHKDYNGRSYDTRKDYDSSHYKNDRKFSSSYTNQTISKEAARYSVDQSPPRRSDSSRRDKYQRKDYEKSPTRRRNSRRLSPEGNGDQISRRKDKYHSEFAYRRDRSWERSPTNKRRKPEQSSSTTKGKNANRSPSEKRKDCDQSPPRRGRSPREEKKKHSYPDRTPPRSTKTQRKRLSSDQSPVRRNIKQEKLSSDDLSPQRKSRIEQKTLSRWQRNNRSESPPPTHKPKAVKTLDGKKSGLQNSADLQAEVAERRRQEDKLFNDMPSELSGRDAEVRVRTTGRLGRKGRAAREENPKEREKREAFEQQKKDLYDRWGKGLKQIEDYRQQKADEAYEGSKPLARYANDKDLDRLLREKEHHGDPMLEYMRRRRKEKEGDKLAKPSIPVYEGSYPENRFGIRPGYRWDGVDRSNGYESKWFEVQNEKKARQEEAYKYSVEDM